MALRILSILGVVLCLPVGDALGQSLAEMAEREKRRREAAAQEGREAPSFSNEDLGTSSDAPDGDVADRPSGRARPARPRSSDGDEARGASSAEAEAAAYRESQRDEGDLGPGSVEAGASAWRASAEALRAAIAAAQRALDKAEAELQGATRGVRRQPGRSEGMEQDPNHLLTRDTALDELTAARDAAREALEVAQAALARFQQEARRKRVPPGWIR